MSNAPRHQWLALALCLILGQLGVHNFYLRQPGYGAAKLALFAAGVLLVLISRIPEGFVVAGVMFAANAVWAFIEFFRIASGELIVDGRGIPIQ